MGGYVIMSDWTSAGHLKAYPYLAGIIVPLLILGVIALIAMFTIGNTRVYYSLAALRCDPRSASIHA